MDESTAESRCGGSVNRPVIHAIPESGFTAANDLAFAVRDRHPVSPGHALVVTRRAVEQWWNATNDEQHVVLWLVDEVKAILDQRTPRPDGYNVGFNAGAAAGQTVAHLHVHVIPRYRGDMADPRGGVRHLIPWEGNYLVGELPAVALRDGPARPLSPMMADCLADRRIDHIDLAVSFIMRASAGPRDSGCRRQRPLAC